MISVLFGHNSKNLVKIGDKVKKGDVLYRMGTTGFSTGNHVHIGAVDGKQTKPWYRDDFQSGRVKPLEKETLSFFHKEMFKYNGKIEKPYITHGFYEMRTHGYHYGIDVVTDNSWKGETPDGLWTKDEIGVVLAVGDDRKSTSLGYGNYVIIGYETDSAGKGNDYIERRFGIDVSEFQDSSRMNYAKLAEQIDFAILRVGGTFRQQQGKFYYDVEFINHYNGFEKHKVPMGAYWYSIANTYENGRKEAEAMLKVIAPFKLEYPIVIDVEEPTCTTDGVVGFCETIEKAGYYVMIYANTDYLTRRLDNQLIKPFDIWLANWTKSPTSPLPYGMWQYTSHGVLSGFVGNLDLNYAYKDYPSIIANNKLNPVKGKRPTAPKVETETTPPPSKLPTATTYIVRAGDTLSGIAEKVNKLNGTNLTYQDLAKLNGLDNPNLIHVGEVLKLTSDAPVKDLVYIVKAGDTLTSIAKAHGTTYHALATLNGLRNPHLIYIGQEIKIKAGANTQYYTVKSGDTLGGIAERFNTSLSDILRLNTIPNPDLIYPSQKIRVK